MAFRARRKAAPSAGRRNGPAPRRIALALLLLLAACDDEAKQDFQGYTEGDYLRIAAPDAGWLESVAVAEGSQVRAGALLFTLDPAREVAAAAEARARLSGAESDLADLRLGARPEEIDAIEAQLAEAEAAAHLTELTRERQIRLFATRVVSQSQVDNAVTAAQQAAAQVARVRAELATARLPARRDRVKAAEAAVDAARHAMEQADWRLAQRRVASPADALVDDVPRRVGEWVPANGVVVSLLPPGAVKAVFFVPEPRRATLRPDAPMAISCTGCPAGLTARISRIASEAEYTPPVIYSRETRAKLVFRVEATFAPGAVTPTPGQPITVRAVP